MVNLTALQSSTISAEKTHQRVVKDDDILLSWAGDASMTFGEVKCVADNVLVQVTKVEEETASGIALAAGVSEQTRTTSGVVVKTGTGRVAADGASVPVPVEVGERQVQGLCWGRY